jgi:HlyD family secretion protein
MQPYSRPPSSATAALLLGWLVVGAGACGGEPAEAGLSLVTVTRRDIVVSASAAGVVEPVMTVEVKSKASGEIVEVLVEEGEAVRAGQLLVRVDPRIPLNAVVQAEADSAVALAELENAEAQLRRAETLWESQAITELEYENAKLARASGYARLVSARRALEDARIAYEETEVRAASAGVILGRNVEVGSVIASASRDVSGGAVLLRMASLDTVQVRALVDETDIGMIRDGMPVTITVEAFPNRPFSGAVLRIGAEAVVQQNVTMFPVLIRIANREGLLRPGMNAEVEVRIGEVRGGLAVPNSALRTREDLLPAVMALGLTVEDVEAQLGERLVRIADDGFEAREGGDVRQAAERDQGRSHERAAALFGGSYVAFALRNGAPRAVAVETGLTDFDYTAVVSGLEEGDTLVVLPTSGLIEELQRREEWVRERVGGPLSGQGRG